MPDNFNPIYYNVIDQIYHSEWVATKLARLEMVKQSIKQLWPQGYSAKCIQVAGTSGKGSVCHYLAAGFSLKHRSATLTSPHLFDYRERFSVEGAHVSQQDITEIWEELIRPLCINQALHGEYYVHTVHEINILMALALWEKYKVDWGIVETGIGVRYDQTTALDIEAAVITNIGNDHQEALGKEQWQRTLDKGANMPKK